MNTKDASCSYPLCNRVNFRRVEDAWKFGLWCERKSMDTDVVYEDGFYCVLVDGFCNKTVYHLYKQEK